MLMEGTTVPTARPGLLDGGGGRTLRWVGLIGYVLLWAWLVVTLLTAGAWIAASLAATALVALWLLPSAVGVSRLARTGGVAAVLGAVAWTAGPVLDATGLGGDLTGSGAVAAALLWLPAVLAFRQRVSTADPTLGAVGFALGFAPVFGGAALASGVLAPFSGWLALPSVWLGQMLLLAGAVPFAVVSAWARVLRPSFAIALVAGAGCQVSIGALDPAGFRVAAALSAGVFALGWVGVGAALIRPAPASVSDGPPTGRTMRHDSAKRAPGRTNQPRAGARDRTAG